MAVCSLPGEILLEILSRLPKKSLRRFEIVSKEWRKLIKEEPSLPAKSTDFGFVVFVHQDIEKTIFYRLDDRGGFAVEDSISFSSPLCMWLKGSCNGVVFYCKGNQVNNERSYHLYNPLTKHLTNLPRLPPFRSMDHDPDPRAIGVAPLPESNHFRFIVAYIRISRGMNRTHSRGLKIATFDSVTREWKTRPAIFSDESYEELADLCSSGFDLGASRLCFEESLYWVQSFYLILFSLKTESFRILYVPETSNHVPGVVWESEGRLKYSQICPNEGLRIWVFRGAAKTRENWKIIFHISVPTLNSLLAETIGSCPHHKPLSLTCVSAFNEHLQMFHLQTEEGVSVSYHIPNKRMTLVSLSGFDGYANLLQPFAYRKHDLPDLEGTDPDSATGRKRSLAFSPTTFRRSTRNKR